MQQEEAKDEHGSNEAHTHGCTQKSNYAWLIVNKWKHAVVAWEWQLQGHEGTYEKTRKQHL